MHLLLAAALLLIPLGGPFLDARASAERVGSQMEVELVLDASPGADAAVAHLVVGGDEPQRTVSLDARSDGTLGGFVTLPIQDAVVVFELLSDADTQTLSTATTLTALGVDFTMLIDPSGFSPPRTAEPDGLSNDNRQWLWLSIAFGAAALSALAFWARADRSVSQPEEVGDDGSLEDVSADPG